MLGARKSKNLINHIGEYTQGKKFLRENLVGIG